MKENKVLRGWNMLNYLWAGMILAGILWGAFHGNMAEVTEGALMAAKEAVTLCITMLGVMALWTGILEIGQKAGLVDQLSEKMRPILKWLFPKLPKEHPAMKSIAVNIIANFLGLGWAATPAGLRAMKELQTLNRDRGGRSDTASDEMCIFLILNISSLQLIPVNMIAYRAQYGSADPTAVVGPALLATTISTVAAIIYCKIIGRKEKR